VIWHDYVGVFTDIEVCVGGEKISLAEFLDFTDQYRGINDHAVAKDAGLVIVKDARRHEVQYGLNAFNNEGVPRIIPSLKTGYDIGLASKYVNDFPFPSSPHWVPTIIKFAMVLLLHIILS